MLRQSCIAFSVLKQGKWFGSRPSEFLPPAVRGIKMRADINWIIPDIMTSTNDLRKETLVSHISPKFFDEKDDQRQCYLEIESRRSLLIDNLTLYVWLKQPLKSSISTKVAVVVRDEKEGQPRQLLNEKTTHSTKIFGPKGNIAKSFKIGLVKDFKKLSTVSIHCTVEYDQDDLKALQTESSVIDVDRDPIKLPGPSIINNNRCISDYDTNDFKDNDTPINQVASPIIDVDQNSTGSIQQDLEQIFKYQSATDIFFIIGNYRLGAHKLILSARSPVFAAIIKAAEANDNLKDGIEIKNMSFTTSKELIHFIYTDQVSLTERNADSLLAAAQKYSVPLLINKCEDFLYSTSLTVVNCSEKLIDADANKVVHLKKMVVDFIRSNPGEVMKTNGWTKLRKSHPDLAFEVMKNIWEYRAS